MGSEMCIRDRTGTMPSRRTACEVDFGAGASPGLTGGGIDDAVDDGSSDLHWQVDAENSVFAERAAIPARASAPSAGISQRMLTRNLRQLESNGLVSRRVTQSKTIAVEYSLTRLGRTLVDPLGGMCRWAKWHDREVMGEVHVSRPQQSCGGEG